MFSFPIAHIKCISYNLFTCVSCLPLTHLYLFFLGDDPSGCSPAEILLRLNFHVLFRTKRTMVNHSRFFTKRNFKKNCRDLNRNWTQIDCLPVRNTKLFSVLAWGCNWILFMHGSFCPIRLIHLIGRKLCILKKTRCISHGTSQIRPFFMHFGKTNYWRATVDDR